MDGANPYVHPLVDAINAGEFRYYNYNVPLVSAFFNIEKYFPLLLTQQGIDVYLTLNAAINVDA